VDEFPDAVNDFIVEEGTVGLPKVVTVTSSTTSSASSSTSPMLPPPPPSPFHDVAQQTPRTLAQAAGQGVEFAAPPGTGEADLDANHDDDAPLRFRKVDNVLGSTSAPGLAQRELEEHLLLASDVEPTCFAEAQKHEC